MNIIINNSSMQPIYEQIVEQIKAAIMKEVLKKEESLPSVRTLSKDLRISALTVKKAYDMLEQDGFIVTVHGKGSFVAGVNAALAALGKDPMVFPRETQIGALAAYVSSGGVSSHFQPMNANFGIISPLEKKVKGGKKFRNEAYAERSLEIIDELSKNFE